MAKDQRNKLLSEQDNPPYNQDTNTDQLAELKQGCEGGYTELEAPEYIIQTANQARRIYEQFLDDHRMRFSQMAKIKGQYYSKKPRDQKALDKKGLGHMANFNNGHARIQINRYLDSEYSFIHNVTSPVNFKVRITGDKRMDGIIAKTMSRIWKEVYLTNPDFLNQIDATRLDKALYGMGITIRQFNADKGEQGWEVKAISPDQFLCPLSTEVSHTSLSKFTITYKKSAQELWSVYDSLSEDSEDLFWRKQALGYVLYKNSKQFTKDSTSQSSISWQRSILDMQEKIRTYQSSLSEYFADDIELVSVYTKEWSGEWSQTIIATDTETDEPVFFHGKQYKALNEFLDIWLFEPGIKTYSGVRGLGYRLYQPIEVQNRLDNIMVDKAHLDATVFLRSKAGRGRDPKSVAITPGTYNDIGEVEFVQQLTGGNVNTTMAVNQYQSQIVERNVQFEGNKLDEPGNQYRTLGEVGLQATQDAVITKPQVSYFYRQYDKFLQNTIMLIYKGAKDEYFEEWKELVSFELSLQDIPPQIMEQLFEYPTSEKDINRQGLPKWLQVYATRSTSSGSQVADILAANRMFQLAQFMGTDERYSFLQDATAAYDDHDKVQVYFPDKNRPDVFTDQQQKAVYEDMIMKLNGITGKSNPETDSIPVSPEDDHKIEAPVHIQSCRQLVAEYTEGGDPIAIDNQLRLLYPHFMAHFTMLSQDPMAKAVYESLAPARGEVENMFRQIQANAQNMREAQQAEQEQLQRDMLMQELRGDPDSIESKKLEMDTVLKARKDDMDQNRKMKFESVKVLSDEAASRVKQSLEVNEFTQDQARKNAETVAKIRRENAIAASKIQNDKK